MKVVAVGGGHGASSTLRAALNYSSEVGGIINVSDDGGSSGVLSQQLGVLPMGDIRNCLAAVAENAAAAEIFQHRFSAGPLKGHVIGNLWLADATERLGSFISAVNAASQLLDCRGEILPPTLEPTRLISEVDDRLVEGQVNVSAADGLISYVSLDPPEPEAYEPAVEMMTSADQIILGPGSLFTSVLPPLLVPGMTEALKRAKGLKIYVCNVAAPPGETAHFDAAAHLTALFAHLGESAVDVMVAHSGRTPASEVPPATVDIAAIERLGVQTVLADVLPDDREPLHDHNRLGEVLRTLDRMG